MTLNLGLLFHVKELQGCWPLQSVSGSNDTEREICCSDLTIIKKGKEHRVLLFITMKLRLKLDKKIY